MIPEALYIPFPMTPTFIPSVSKLQSHRAECMILPLKSPNPSISGYLGWFSCPTADTRKSQEMVYPSAYSASLPPVTLTSTFQRDVASSHVALVADVLNRMYL